MARIVRALATCALAIGPAGAIAPQQSIGRWLLDAALSSPLYKAVLVPQAKRTMVDTAESNGVRWRESLDWIQRQGPWELPAKETIVEPPEYYRQPFHAYEEGNLCWEAAWEGEIASRAVGARNFPQYGPEGEIAFRGAFDEALGSLGGTVPKDGVIVDLGCGTGVSTRRLAQNFPEARSVLGLDLSPHFITVGRKLLDLGNTAEPKGWVNKLERESRVTLRCADAGKTGLEDASCDVVVLSLVIHELPPDATMDISAEALRILKPGGQLWVTEMDFETPAFSKLRANPLLFSLIRSTEPYLDVYADWQPQFPMELRALGFETVSLAAATGRHFALVATKAMLGAKDRKEGIDDRRKDTAKEDTHLKTWESKSKA